MRELTPGSQLPLPSCGHRQHRQRESVAATWLDHDVIRPLQLGAKMVAVGRDLRKWLYRQNGELGTTTRSITNKPLDIKLCSQPRKAGPVMNSSFLLKAPKLWNQLPESIQHSHNKAVLRSKLKKHFLPSPSKPTRSTAIYNSAITSQGTNVGTASCLKIASPWLSSSSSLLS
jgi:hypothetical protein